MIIIRMTGGLGNQMFQYALYLKLVSQGKEVKMDDVTEYKGPFARPIQLHVFGITYPAASREEINQVTDGFPKITHKIRRKLFGRRSLEYQEIDCNFDEQVLERDPAYLSGYFQSEKYFADIKEKVREAFTFGPVVYEKLDGELRNKFESSQREIAKTASVSLHIRRGDYLENEEAYGGICTQKYYEKAIDLMENKLGKPRFFVFCNEDEWAENWCREQEKKRESEFVPIKGFPEKMGYLDMYLMSQCKHHIIANSSFSWWGAYLGSFPDKVVIAPAKWHNQKDYGDIYTDAMLRVTSQGQVRD